MAIGAIFNDNENGTDSGHVRVYKLQSDQDLTVTVVDTTVPVIILKGPSNVTVERGSPYTEQGAIAIDYPEWGSWVRQGEDIIGEAAGDQSGWSVSLSADGTIVAIGAIIMNDENGNVIVVMLEFIVM